MILRVVRRAHCAIDSAAAPREREEAIGATVRVTRRPRSGLCWRALRRATSDSAGAAGDRRNGVPASLRRRIRTETRCVPGWHRGGFRGTRSRYSPQDVARLARPFSFSACRTHAGLTALNVGRSACAAECRDPCAQVTHAACVARGSVHAGAAHRRERVSRRARHRSAVPRRQGPAR
jgi:hypothetical protein